MSRRNVKSPARALAHTDKPVVMKQALSNIKAGDTLQNFIAGMGNERDKRTHSFYGTPRTLTRYELENLFRTSWLAKKIVTCVADDMTREWRRFLLGDADDNPQLEALQTEEKKLNVKGKITEALYWARLYGGCLVVMGVNDTNDLSQPLNVDRLGKGCLKYLHVLDRWRVSPEGSLNLDLGDPNFALPDYYIVAESSVRVHSSRILRFNGAKLPYFAWLQNARWDDSELQHPIETLLNSDTTASAIASMMFEANIDVVRSAGFADLLATDGGEKKVIKRFQMSQMMKSFNRTLVMDAEDQYEKKQNVFTNLADVWEKMQDEACGAADIPHTRLFGQSPAGMSATGDSDLENYYGRIGAEQESKVRPALDQFDEVFVRHTLGSMPADYAYEFNKLWVMSDSDQATIDFNNAQRDQIYINAGVVTPGLVASELKAKGTYSSMSSEDVEMAEELGQPMNPDQQLEEQGNRMELMQSFKQPDEDEQNGENTNISGGKNVGGTTKDPNPVEDPQTPAQAKKANGRAGSI